jgi:hypothetical protein
MIKSPQIKCSCFPWNVNNNTMISIYYHDFDLSHLTKKLCVMECENGVSWPNFGFSPF